MDNHELAHMLFPKREDSAPRVIRGVAVGDSADGRVSVDVGGTVVTLPTTDSAKAGDAVTVVSAGPASMAALGTTGAGDRQDAATSEAKAQAARAQATADGVNQQLQQSISAINDKIADGNAAFEAKLDSKTRLGAVSQGVMDFDGDALRIGKASSDLYVSLSSVELAFWHAGMRLAYINGQWLAIPNADIGTLRIGGFLWATEADGSLSLRRS